MGVSQSLDKRESCCRADRNVQCFYFLPHSLLCPLCRVRSPRKPIQRCSPRTNLFHLCNDPMRSCLVSSTLQMKRLGTGMLGILSEDKQNWDSSLGRPSWSPHRPQVASLCILSWKRAELRPFSQAVLLRAQSPRSGRNRKAWV